MDCLFLIVSGVLLIFQGLLFGPLYHYWYIYLDRAFPGRKVCVVLKKLAADQLFMTPVALAIFFISLSILERQTFNEMQSDIRQKFGPLLTAEWTLGSASQMFSFFVLPTRFRVVYDNVVCLCFDAYYSRVKYRKELQCDELTSDAASGE